MNVKRLKPGGLVLCIDASPMILEGGRETVIRLVKGQVYQIKCWEPGDTGGQPLLRLIGPEFGSMDWFAPCRFKAV